MQSINIARFNLKRLPIAIAISAILLATATPSWATPHQYRAGYTAGAAVGNNIGKSDGSGESGTNAMHTNASCSIDRSKHKDFDRGYTLGCRTAYERAFIKAYKHRQQIKAK